VRGRRGAEDEGKAGEEGDESKGKEKGEGGAIGVGGPDGEDGDGAEHPTQEKGAAGQGAWLHRRTSRADRLLVRGEGRGVTGDTLPHWRVAGDRWQCSTPGVAGGELRRLR